MSKNFGNNACETSSCCPCGWLKKKVFGLSICTWLVFFAVLPYSAKGISWTATHIAGWVSHATDAVVHREQPQGAERPAPQVRKNEVGKRGN